MTPKSLLIIASLLVVTPGGTLYAQQDQQNEGDKPERTVRTPDGGRERIGPAVGSAVARPAPQPAPAPAQPAATRAERPVAAAASAPVVPAADDQRREGGRDRGDNPAVGRAVPRDTRPAPSPAPQSRGGARSEPRYRGGSNVYAPPVYNYYYYPRRYYPYGYGAFGLGYFYYDPYTWYPPSYYSGYYGGGYYGGGGGGGYYGGFFDEGELRIDVSPRFADVYVDGYFAGRVDDFDGVFQSLKLESGPHHIQIVAPGFTTLDFDVRIEQGRKITYRGALQPYRP